MWCAFLSGIYKRWAFPIFTAAYWILPNIVIANNAGNSVGKDYYSKYLDVVAGYSKILVDSSLWGVSGLLHVPAADIAGVPIIVCAAAFAAGRLVYERSDALKR